MWAARPWRNIRRVVLAIINAERSECVLSLNWCADLSGEFMNLNHKELHPFSFVGVFLFRRKLLGLRHSVNYYPS
jgi:hypothetical protein